jgi:hypothetical protein
LELFLEKHRVDEVVGQRVDRAQRETQTKSRRNHDRRTGGVREASEPRPRGPLGEDERPNDDHRDAVVDQRAAEEEADVENPVFGDRVGDAHGNEDRKGQHCVYRCKRHFHAEEAAKHQGQGGTAISHCEAERHPLHPKTFSRQRP